TRASRASTSFWHASNRALRRSTSRSSHRLETSSTARLAVSSQTMAATTSPSRRPGKRYAGLRPHFPRGEASAAARPPGVYPPHRRRWSRGMKPGLRLAAGLPLAQVMGLILVSAVALAGWAAVRLEADGPGAAGPTVQSGPEAAAPARRLRLAAFNIR